MTVFQNKLKYTSKETKSPIFADFDGENIDDEIKNTSMKWYLPGLVDDLSLLDVAGNDFSTEKVQQGLLQLNTCFLRVRLQTLVHSLSLADYYN